MVKNVCGIKEKRKLREKNGEETRPIRIILEQREEMRQMCT